MHVHSLSAIVNDNKKQVQGLGEFKLFANSTFLYCDQIVIKVLRKHVQQRKFAALTM